MLFFSALEPEFTRAILAGKSIMICFDANSKMSQQYIPGDPHVISENGKILEGILNRNALIVVNGIIEKSTGVITRSRTTKDGEEKSAIDLFILSSDMVTNLQQIIIDEDKKFALESITKTKKGFIIKNKIKVITTHYSVSVNKDGTKM